ncbi:MAG: hypothetical protein EXS09_18330 [Gemmataceae bacterium]|nr:hypothetical protein [Gemmataceae bacterium]
MPVAIIETPNKKIAIKPKRATAPDVRSGSGASDGREREILAGRAIAPGSGGGAWLPLLTVKDTRQCVQ